MRLGHGIDVGEGIAFVAQASGYQLGGTGHYLAGEHLSLLDQQQGLDLLGRHLQIAGELDVADTVFFVPRRC